MTHKTFWKAGRKDKWKPEIVDGYAGDEAGLQQHIEQTCAVFDIECRRVPDSVWAFLKMSAPARIVKALSRFWKDKPDLLMLIPVSDRYSLALDVELKAQHGKLSKGQKDYSESMPVVVSRSPEQTHYVMAEFRKVAGDIANHLTKGKCDE